MPADGPTSPTDPEWVDEIVRRALERAGADESLATAAAPPPDHAAPSQPPEPTPPQPVAEPPHRAAPVAPVSPLSVPLSDPPAQPEMAPRAASHSTQALVDTTPAKTAPPPVDEIFGERPPEPQPDHDRVPEAAVNAGRVSPYPEPPARTPVSDADERVFATIGGAEPYPDLENDPMFDTALGLEGDDDVSGSSRMRGFLEWGAVIVGALAVALVIKTFLMQAYFIPSGSMEPTLEIGDRVLVNKLSYDFGDIGRGDLVVFHRPPSQADGEDDLIKRVIALGGEVIEMHDGEIFITTVGSSELQRLDEPYLADDVRTTGLVNTDNCVNPTPTSCEIPEGHVFVLGDNRGFSRDSRWFGPISEDLVVGRAFLRVWPVGDAGFL